MTDQSITHKSGHFYLLTNLTALETTIKKGVKCDGSGIAHYDKYKGQYTGITLAWDFDWRELAITGVDGLSGYITVTSPQNYFDPQKIQVDFLKTNETVEINIYTGYRNVLPTVVFEYILYPHRSYFQKKRAQGVSYDELFSPSEKNDTVLVVDGKKLHVNKEWQMDEIPIKDISFKNFGLLMSIIYPKTAHPNDSTVEKLLELADRFIIPAVIGHVEYHLLHISSISHEKMTWMADRYEMPELLEKCVREINTVEKFKVLNGSPEYKKLSEKTMSRILNRLAEFL